MILYASTLPYCCLWRTSLTPIGLKDGNSHYIPLLRHNYYLDWR